MLPNLRTLSFILLALSTAPPATARQADPLKALRKKAEEIQKKIDCATGAKGCPDKGKPEGAKPPGAPASPLNATVNVTPMAPMPANTLIPSVVSDDFAHAAGVAMKGSRMVLIVDGQEGPPFDEIKPSDGRSAAVFSPGGKRVAYIGKRGGEEIAVVDGKEGSAYKSIGAGRGLLSAAESKVFLFSQTAVRVAYTIEVVSGAPSAAARVTGRPELSARVVLDGLPGPEYYQIGDMLFAGERLVYIARTKEGKYVAVVDQKPMTGAPFDAINFLMASDDGHFAFVGNRGNSWTVVLDGVEGKTHQRPDEQFDGRTIVISPRKGRVAYLTIGREQIPSVNLYVDGKVMRTSNGFDGLTFSPDGTRLGGTVFQTSPGGSQRHYAFVDDWNSLDYRSFAAATAGQSTQKTLYFSPDSKRFAFIAVNGMSNFAIVDGQESSGYAEIKNFQFSHDSRRYAFEARYPNTSGAGSVVVVDGKEGPKLQSITPNSLAFSPDGSRVAYAGNATAMETIAVVDGVSQKARTGGFAPRVPKAVGGVPVVPRYFAFSPDGRRLARVEQLLDGSGQNTVVVDGTPHVPGNLFSMPVFSADGRHFAYAAWSNQKWLLSVDGKSMPIDGDLYEAPNSLTFQEDGSVQFLVLKGDMLSKAVVSAIK
jgi:hypothetical protein